MVSEPNRSNIVTGTRGANGGLSRLVPVLLAVFALGMSGAQHMECFRKVMGVDKGKTRDYRNTVQACFRRATDVPDDYSDFLKRVKSDPAFTKWSYGSYGHRLLFHWGFQADPRKHSPMAEQVAKAGLPAADEDRLYGLLITEQIRRNNDLMKAMGATFGIAKRDDRQAVAALLYDTHLVGDYIVHSKNTEATRDGVQPLPYVVADIRVRLHQIMKGDCGAASRIGAALAAAVESDPYNGEGVMAVLEAEFPDVIKSRFGPQMAAKGVVLIAD